MRKLECSCGSRQFFVNLKQEMVQCFSCRQRYKFSNGAWEKFQVKKELKKAIGTFIDKCIGKAIKPVQEAQETMGQWMKRHNIEWQRKKNARNGEIFCSLPETERPIPKEFNLNKKQIAKIRQKDHIRKKWLVEIYGLNSKYKEVKFFKNDYNGKLRGRNCKISGLCNNSS